MKKAFLTLVALIGAISLVGCSTNDSSITNGGDSGNQTDTENPNTGSGDSSNTGGSEEKAGNAIVVYFSATGNTERVAHTIAGHIDSAIYELEPVDPYTSADLNYGNQSSRVVEEHNRIIAGENVNIELVDVDFEEFADADYVFLGAPVWWQELSWVIEDFVASNDFSNKTIIPFGTSTSSGYTLGNLTPLIEDDENVTWLDPQRFRSSVSDDDVIEWVDGLGIDFSASLVEAPGDGSQSNSNISSIDGVPLLTLNNGVEMPQFGLGTQVQELENGDLGILNQTVRESVTSALESGYRHLDSAHGYMNERGVGQGIIDSGVLREEIWLLASSGLVITIMLMKLLMTC